jgi:hypothetical protein
MEISMRLVLILALALGVTACANKRVQYEGAALTKNVATGPAASASVTWLKNKKENVDVSLRLTNEYPNSILFRLSKMKMTLGGVSVNPRDASDIVELMAGVTVERVLIFPFGATKPMEGTAEVTLTPEQDGKDLPPIKMALTLTK